MRRESRFVLPCVGGRSGTDDRIPATGDSAGRGDSSYGAVGGAAADFPHRIAAVLRLAIKRTFREASQVRVRMFGGAAAAVAVGSVRSCGRCERSLRGAPASDRSAHSVPAGSRTGSVGGALNRIAFGLRRSGKIPFGMLPSDRVQAGNPFGERRCGKIPPPSFPKKNRFDKPGAEPNGSSGSAEAGKATVEKRAIATRCFAPKTAFADARRSEGDLSDGSAAQSEGRGAAEAEGA